VEVEKKDKKDVTITIQLESDDGFPEETQSNTDWRNGLKQSSVELTEAGHTIEYYQMQVLCPKAQQTCLYVIPGARKFLGTLVHLTSSQ